MIICIKSDYDGYFERLTRKIVGYAKCPKYQRIILTSGPYRSSALTVNRIDDITVQLDFYSAIRCGFGSLTEQDLRAAAEMI